MPIKCLPTKVPVIDDSSHKIGPTSAPPNLQKKSPIEVKQKYPTGTAFEDESDEASSIDIGTSKPRPFGRTLPDLVVEFVNEPRAMATILMLVSIALFVVKINGPSDFWMPLSTWAFLILLWFGVPYLSKLFSNKKDK